MAGGGDSGYTFAMVTHEAPGDAFWDRIRAGAEQAAKDTGSTLKYSADPEATKQAVLIQNAIDSKVDGIATTLVTPESLIPTVKKAVAAGIPVDSFNSGTDFYKEAGALTHFSSDERLAGQQAGAKAKADGATKILCTIQQTGSVALEDRCAGVKDSFPNTENIQVNGQDDSAVTSAIQAKLAQDKDINWIITLGATQAVDALKAMDAVKSQAKLGTFDLSQQAAEAVKAGNDPVLHRPAAIPAGLPGGHPALSLQEERQHPRRRQAVADRPVVRRQHQRRHHPAVHQPKHPLVLTPARPGRAARPDVVLVERDGLSGPVGLGGPTQRSITMSQTVKTPPAAAPSEASNRVTLGLSNRLLARPEVGALVAAIVIFIFFLIVAPSFRSAPPSSPSSTRPRPSASSPSPSAC